MTSTLNRFALATLPFAAAIVLAGCGGGGGTSLTTATFCAQRAEKECGTATTGVAHTCVVTVEACKAKRVAACNVDVAAWMDPIKRPFQADKANDCLNKTSAAFQKANITPADLNGVNDACQRVFSGKKKPTDTDPTCGNNYECDVGFFCDLSLTVPICATKKTVAASAGCANPGETCPDTQYCAVNVTTTQRMCMDRPTLGNACALNTMPCLNTARCAADTTGAFKCADKVMPGTACTADIDCPTTTPYCDPYNGNVCDPGLTPAFAAPPTAVCQAFGAV